MTRYTVLIADELPVVRTGIKALVKNSDWVHECREAGCVEELFRLLREQPQHPVLVLDVTLPDAPIFRLIGEIRRQFPLLPILAMGVFPPSAYRKPSLAAGANGYLNKVTPVEGLVKALEQIAKTGQFELATDNKPRRCSNCKTAGPIPHELLSTRELEVFRRLGNGETSKQIAASLKVSIKTVSTYRARIFKKMKFTSNAEIVRYTIKMNLGCEPALTSSAS